MTSAVGSASWALAWIAGLPLAGFLSVAVSDALPAGAWAALPPTLFTVVALVLVPRGVWRDHVDVHRGGVRTRLVGAAMLACFWLVAFPAGSTGWSLEAMIVAGVCLWAGGVGLGLRALGRARSLAFAVFVVSAVLAWVVLVHVGHAVVTPFAVALQAAQLDGAAATAGAVVAAGAALAVGVVGDLVRGVAGYRDDRTTAGLALVLGGTACLLLVVAGAPAAAAPGDLTPLGRLAALGAGVAGLAVFAVGRHLVRRAGEASGDGVAVLFAALVVIVGGGITASLGAAGHPVAVKVVLGLLATVTGALAGLFGARRFVRGIGRGRVAAPSSVRRAPARPRVWREGRRRAA